MAKSILPKVRLEPSTLLSWSNLPKLRCGNLSHKPNSPIVATVDVGLAPHNNKHAIKGTNRKGTALQCDTA